MRVWAPVGRPGDDRLSRVLRRSTIGAEGFHGRVRDGIGCWAPRHDHQVIEAHTAVPDRAVSVSDVGSWGGWVAGGLAAARGRIKPIERLVPVSFTHCCASTPGLST